MRTRLSCPAADLVTETDQAVEKMVSTTLKDKYPDFSYVLPNLDAVDFH